MKDCIVVTGGAGFIGCKISPALADSSIPVVVIDNLHPQVHSAGIRPEALDPRVTLIQADVVEPQTWVELLSSWRPRQVIHLAAETGTGQSLSEASRHASVNVLGTTRMLDAFCAAELIPDKFVLTSSRAVYGEGQWLGPDGRSYYPGQRTDSMLRSGHWDFHESSALPFEAGFTEPRPTSIYGVTKLAQEQILSAWAASFGSNLAILRLQNVYGPGQSLTNPYTGIVSLFSRIAREGKSIPLYEDGAMRRDFVFIDDVAAAVVASVTGPKMEGQIMDIGTGLGTTISDLAYAVAENYGAPAPHVTAQYRNGDVRHASCRIDAARKTGWEPTVNLREGVKRVCAWIDKELEK